MDLRVCYDMQFIFIICVYLLLWLCYGSSFDIDMRFGCAYIVYIYSEQVQCV